ncbi:MAG: Hsp20/alpha crystallin family protein [Rhodospirillales bacterium]|nr:Hsp20/alpha crystallin family protein [Rhodospirillales bacterium]
MKSLLPFGFGSERKELSPFASLQREMDRLFSDFSRRFGEPFAEESFPKLDICETDSEIKVTAELPGIDEKDIDVTLRDDVLTIKGEKKAEREEKEENYHLVERSYGSFSRSVRLPSGLDANKVKATMDKGVLTVTMPKPPTAQPKKIEIKSAA